MTKQGKQVMHQTLKHECVIGKRGRKPKLSNEEQEASHPVVKKQKFVDQQVPAEPAFDTFKVALMANDKPRTLDLDILSKDFMMDKVVPLRRNSSTELLVRASLYMDSKKKFDEVSLKKQDKKHSEESLSIVNENENPVSVNNVEKDLVLTPIRGFSFNSNPLPIFDFDLIFGNVV